MASATHGNLKKSLAMNSIKEPITAIDDVCRRLSEAVDAHLEGRGDGADASFRAADCQKVWAWVNPSWSRPDLNVRVKAPKGDTAPVAKSLRDPDRNIKAVIRGEVLARDGYRCRYCGIPVVSAEIRKLAHRLYPEAVRWGGIDPSTQHAGFQCLWLQYDHVVPHSHGGRSTADNVVISCALCNFGKDRYTLQQLGIEDPRLRQPEPIDWDGLERLKSSTEKQPHVLSRGLAKEWQVDEGRTIIPKTTTPPAFLQSTAYFLPGAWISKGYVYTPEIAGKERWFQISDQVSAKHVERDGKSGVQLICTPGVLLRRGIEPSGLQDADS
ncbi:HNH endonuclease [Roseovarius tibetensis]|uniref:HNH endonuclease n=1 Tax=Roseovarius tibetensis TaxID=2685897 RepID=UPI003D7FE194